jgi:hypothetical protein
MVEIPDEGDVVFGAYAAGEAAGLKSRGGRY